MTRPVGRGIPRLQELMFLVVAQQAVGSGATFEEVRRGLIEHMKSQREDNAGTGNTAKYQLARDNPYRYVSNASESLKELMRLGLVVQAPLPSEAKSAEYYQKATFGLTEEGVAWAALIDKDRAAAMDRLFGLLWSYHPQFQGYLRVVAAENFTVPLAQWTEFDRTRRGFVVGLSKKAADALAASDMGWSATESEIRRAITTYVEARLEATRVRQRPDPYPRGQDFVGACEEALVKLAFASAGESIDYITHEVLRRWTKDLQVANFSYHVPDVFALRLWPTAEVVVQDGVAVPRRRVSDDVRESVVGMLGEAYEAVRRSEESFSPWVPIYRVRAHVCFRLRIADRVFDRALLEFLAGERGADAPYGVNIDPAQFGNVPPSERPLRVPTTRGPRDVYSMTLVPRLERTAL